ncbi:ankyrin-3 isoform c [Planoprotostelium fungivorum]|uniref:Ankyrin-3 isoform c n=1 Tax=Planoprotostelium fungivorum TaxID=1890364 RepID=A0A2P6NHU4_9EUKA|nr:ankyrin-3 isoform c [Planoprotostelium fungivorum]PRP83528.1 ankyrin-3 isoform c [Planoprotostelium fungivorum]
MMSSRLDAATEFFFEAAARGNVHDLREMCNSQPDVLYRKDVDGWSLLHHAAVNSSADALQFLIQKGAPLDAANKKGETFLHILAQSDNWEAILSINYLLKQDENGASHNPSESILEDYNPSLSDAEDDLSLSSFEYIRTYSASYFYPSTRLESLLTMQESTMGYTPLHIACFNGKIRTAITLTRFAVNLGGYLGHLNPLRRIHTQDVLNSTDAYGRTPLSLSVERRHSSFLVTYLVTKGAHLPPSQEFDLPPLAASTMYNAQLGASGYGSQFLDRKMFNDETSSDVMFIIGSKTLWAHSEVIQRRSESLYHLLLQKKRDEADKEHQTKVKKVKINQVEFRVFYSLIEWMYSNEINISSVSHLLELWRASIKYEMRDLQRESQKKLVKSLTETVSRHHDGGKFKEMKDIFELAHRKGARYINRFCSSYLLEHMDQFLTDSNCFPGLASRPTRGEFIGRENYVAWLFMAVDDRFVDKEKFGGGGPKTVDLQLSQQEMMDLCGDDLFCDGESSAVHFETIVDMYSGFQNTAYGELVGKAAEVVTSKMSSLSSTLTTVSTYLGYSTTRQQVDQDEEDVEEFLVKRTNWYWKQQERILQVTPTHVRRLDPITREVCHSMSIDQLSRIDLVDDVIVLIADGGQMQPPPDYSTSLSGLWNSYCNYSNSHFYQSGRVKEILACL